MKYILFLLFAGIIPVYTYAQYSDLQVPADPAAAYYRQQLTEQVMRQMNKIDWTQVNRRTSSGTALYIIPVVVHVLHEYGAELLADTTIYNLISGINSLYLKTNADTANIMDKFKGVAANTQISFRLATKDPDGNPTKGVEHIFTYLTKIYTNSYNESKINQWPQDRYLNIWVISSFAPLTYGAAIYYAPLDAAYTPYYDGIVVDYNIHSNWLARAAARYLDLPYPCNSFSTTCTDNDGIADTPPCDGTNYTCANIYGTACDTPNTQNIMLNFDPACANMFTYGQGQYMQYILNIDIGKRDSLVSPTNFINTGMDQPVPDMLPVPDFSIKNSARNLASFFCVGQPVRFENKSWNDTITNVAWTFSNSAAIPASTSMAFVTNRFSDPGWVTVSLAATGNNTGTATLTNTQALYIADTTPVNGYGYYQEFSPGGDLDKWPMFNYFNNGFKWQQGHVGCYDNTCIEYTGYDSRSFPANTTGTPAGDYDDVFTPVFDLTGFSGNGYLNFMSSGAAATPIRKYMTDTLEIDYSTSLSYSWQVLAKITNDSLDNRGAQNTPYKPFLQSDWVPQAIPIPLAAQTAHTIFRFRYHPGADSTGMSTGNNFYLDRFNLNSVPAGIAEVGLRGDGISLQPNPTNAGSYVVIKDDNALGMVAILVTDITGRTVYETKSSYSSNFLRTEIPGNTIAGKGMYLVHIITGKWNRITKLIVN